MKIAVARERRTHEHRVAATPDTVKKFVGFGASVAVESGAGLGADIADDDYREAGADIVQDTAALYRDADLILKVQGPDGAGELDSLAPGQTLIAMLDPLRNRDEMADLARRNVTAFAMEMMPRITRAQSMDVLSSQANLAGYKAVLDACDHFNRALPMMMTAAGTIAPAKVFVMGAGVAGLQAIATARRLGAVVSATDVRPAAKEQVESLGASFVMVEDEESAQAETEGGYAKEMSEEYKRKQAALIADTIAKQDIVICTALIPGRPAPTLVDDDMVHAMRPGSVIVDLAVETGGNCTLSKPGEVVDVNGVNIVGHLNVPSRLAADAAALYAKNILNFLSPHFDAESGELNLDFDDETVSGVCICMDGEVVHPALRDGPG